MKRLFIVAVLVCTLASNLAGCSAGTRVPPTSASPTPGGIAVSAASTTNPVGARYRGVGATATTLRTIGGGPAASRPTATGAAATGQTQSKQDAKSPKAAADPSTPKPAPHGPASKTDAPMLANFDKVRSGMSLAQVADIMCSLGTKNGRAGVGKYDVVMYTWEGIGDTAIVNVTFQLNKVTTKAQFGLN